MITEVQAFTAEEFHISHSGLPCIVWRRCGVTFTNGHGAWMVPIEHDGTDEYGQPKRDWHHITGVNAADFHAAEDCPLTRDGTPAVPDNQPPLVPAADSDRSEYDASGYDAEGRDAFGYDHNGYDRDGYDHNGYGRDGYDASGHDTYGYDQAGYDHDGYDVYDRDRAGYDRHGYDAEGYDAEGYNRDGDRYCSDCSEAPCICDTTICDRCGDREPDDEITEVLSGLSICDYCRTNYYTYCDECEGYYRDGDEDEHSHGRGGYDCCDVPQPEFTVRNDGDAPLGNDTRITVTLPEGTISAEGLEAIRRYLRSQDDDNNRMWELSYTLEEIGDQWQTRQGNFTKRLSRHAHQRFQARLTPEIMSQIGCIARDHSKSVDVTIEVSRALNEDAGYWYHEDSCWWGSYSESRCALKTNGGFGMRSFNDSGYVNGRAWVLPLRKDEHGRLVPTFNTMTPDAFVVFNGYGDLDGYTPARIMAHMAGWTYRKISYDDDTMYVNSGGYLIAPEEIAEQYTDGDLRTRMSQHSNLYRIEQERELVNA